MCVCACVRVCVRVLACEGVRLGGWGEVHGITYFFEESEVKELAVKSLVLRVVRTEFHLCYIIGTADLLYQPINRGLPGQRFAIEGTYHLSFFWTNQGCTSSGDNERVVCSEHLIPPGVAALPAPGCLGRAVHCLRLAKEDYPPHPRSRTLFEIRTFRLAKAAKE